MKPEIRHSFPRSDDYRQLTASQLQQEFMDISSDQMDAMPDNEILRQFGMVEIVPESEPESRKPAAQIDSFPAEELATAVAEVTARKSVEDALGDSVSRPKGSETSKREAVEPSMQDMKRFASARAKQLRQENPGISVAEANTRAIADTKEHFNIAPSRGMPAEGSVAKSEKDTGATREPQPGSIAAIVRERVKANRAATGYVSDMERNLLHLSRNRTEVFQPLELQVYDRFTDEQLSQIKSSLLDSLASECLQLKEQKLGSERHDLSVRIEDITQNLLSLQLQVLHRQGASTSAKEGDLGTSIKLPNKDIDRLAEAIPSDSNSLIPIFEEYNRMTAIFSVAKDPREVQAIVSRMDILYQLATKLMLRKAKGWDSVKMSELRRILAHENSDLI